MTDYESKSIPILNDVIDDDDITDEHEVIDLSNLKAPLDDDSFASDGFDGNNREENNLDLFADELTESIDEKEVIAPKDLHLETDDTENSTPEIGNIKDIESPDDLLFMGTAAVGAAAFSTLEDDQLTAKISNEINTAIGNDEKHSFEEENNLAIDLPDDEPETESALINYHDDEDTTHVAPAEVEPTPVTAIDEQKAGVIEHDADTSAAPTISLETMTEDIVKQILPGLEAQLRSLVQQALEEKLPEEFVISSSTGKDQNK